MRIQVNAAGYAGLPVSMLFLFQEETGGLRADRTVKFREGRVKDDFALVTNLDLPDLDYRFQDKHLSEAIRSYFTMAGQGLLDIGNELGRYDPKEKIEMDGVDESGRRYRIHDEIDNGQMAILMAISFVESQKPIRSIIDMTNELSDFYSIKTI